MFNGIFIILAFPIVWLHRAVKYNTYDKNTTVVPDYVLDKLPKSIYRNKELSSYKLVCYYMTPVGDDLEAEKIDPFLCTHVIVSFGRVKNNTFWISDAMNEVRNGFEVLLLYRTLIINFNVLFSRCLFCFELFVCFSLLNFFNQYLIYS